MIVIENDSFPWIQQIHWKIQIGKTWIHHNNHCLTVIHNWLCPWNCHFSCIHLLRYCEAKINWITWPLLEDVLLGSYSTLRMDVLVRFTFKGHWSESQSQCGKVKRIGRYPDYEQRKPQSEQWPSWSQFSWCNSVDRQIFGIWGNFNLTENAFRIEISFWIFFVDTIWVSGFCIQKD